jgi:uncharacterized protein with von Willebrand factor type A (vWA) domain
MDEPETQPVAAWASLASEELIRRVLRFAQLVRSHGMAVTSGRVIDAQRSLQYINLGRRDDVYHALRANFIAQPEDIPRFDLLFIRFWHGDDAPEQDGEVPREPPIAGTHGTLPWRETERITQTKGETRDPAPDAEVGEHRPGYSAVEELVARDFSTLDAGELKKMRQIMARMAPKLLTLRSRRFRPGVTGSRIDFPRSLRQSLHTGGDVIDLAWRRRQVDTAHLVLLCDVSRSMEKYSRFLIQFMYAFQNELPSTETFVFSTRLTRLTSTLRARNLDDALDEATSTSTGWSSGTKIGECLEQFNHQEAPRMLDRRTVVVVLSDGWDGGDPALLGEQMAAIKRRSRSVVWLNPLLGDPRYRPLVSGMRAALPHIDLFLPCHNLASLQAFAAQLRRL